MFLKRNCSLPCSYLITWVGIVFRPHDESVKEKYAMEEKKTGVIFFQEIYIQISDMRKKCSCVCISLSGTKIKQNNNKKKE